MCFLRVETTGGAERDARREGKGGDGAREDLVRVNSDFGVWGLAFGAGVRVWYLGREREAAAGASGSRVSRQSVRLSADPLASGARIAIHPSGRDRIEEAHAAVLAEQCMRERHGGQRVDGEDFAIYIGEKILRPFVVPELRAGARTRRSRTETAIT